MYIEISREVVTFAEHNNRYAIEMLEKLALAVKYNKHIVFTGLRLLDRILQIDSLDALTKNQYSKIRNRYSTIGALIHKLDFRAVVLMGGENRRTRKRILIDSTKADKFEVYEESHLLTENLQDGKFFEYLVKKYAKNQGITLSGTPICYMPQMGGGSTIAMVYKMEIERCQHFCLSILDSDKRYPSCGKGETFSSLRRVDKDKYLGDCDGNDGQYAFNCSYYVMDELRELENLIPIEVLKTMDNVRSNPLLQMTFDMSYHDMKDGLLAKKVNVGDYQIYLDKLFSFDQAIVDYIDFCVAYRQCCGDKEEYEKDCGRLKLVNGLGSNIMEQVLKNAQPALEHADFSKLSLSQKKEWENIGKKIFEWCCFLDLGIS